jgi:hypothetical protein
MQASLAPLTHTEHTAVAVACMGMDTTRTIHQRLDDGAHGHGSPLVGKRASEEELHGTSKASVPGPHMRPKRACALFFFRFDGSLPHA